MFDRVLYCLLQLLLDLLETTDIVPGDSRDLNSSFPERTRVRRAPPQVDRTTENAVKGQSDAEQRTSAIMVGGEGEGRQVVRLEATSDVSKCSTVVCKDRMYKDRTQCKIGSGWVLTREQGV